MVDISLGGFGDAELPVPVPSLPVPALPFPGAMGVPDMMGTPNATAPAKAYIQVMSAGSFDDSSGGVVWFDYNPKDLSYTKSANWERKPSSGATATANPEFKGAEPIKMTVPVYLDGYEADADISGDIQTLVSCCQPTSTSIGQNTPSAPFVQFGWGSMVYLTGIVTSVSVKILLFAPDGTPRRAECSVSIEEVQNNPAPTNPTSGSPRTIRSHVMVAGDSLPAVAYRQYGRADWWRALAAANGIDDPSRVPDGTRLLIPDLDDPSLEVN